MRQDEVREALASGYAAGSLDPALQLLVEAQSALASSENRIIPRERPQIRPHVARAAPVARTLIEELSALPAVIQDAAIRALARRRWKSPILGVKLLRLDLNSQAEATLLRVKPQAAIPRHTHEGAEYALVLTGMFADGVGRYQPGEISLADATVTHRPRAGDGAVCWVLVVRYGGLRWTGLLGRLQRLLGR